MTAARRILVFDVNETLLDVRSLEPIFAEWLNDAGAMRRWFAQTVLYSQALSLSGRYVSFGRIGAAMLEMLAHVDKRELPSNAFERLKDEMSALPAHADVRTGLSRLQDEGMRMVTLTNSDAQTQSRQLSNAGISEFFEAQFSVDATGQFKPAQATYRYVASQLGVDTCMLSMVACHSWDLVGARAAGYQTVFLHRPGNQQPNLEGVQADFHVDEVGQLLNLT